MASIATRGGVRLGHILQWELKEGSNHSRKTITIREATAKDYVIGEVLGKVTATGKYKQLDPAATDGSEDFAGIFIGTDNALDPDNLAVADTTDTSGVILFRDAGVGKLYLRWIAGVTAPQKAAVYAQMEAAGFTVLDQLV